MDDLTTAERARARAMQGVGHSANYIARAIQERRNEDALIAAGGIGAVIPAMRREALLTNRAEFDSAARAELARRGLDADMDDHAETAGYRSSAAEDRLYDEGWGDGAPAEFTGAAGESLI